MTLSRTKSILYDEASNPLLGSKVSAGSLPVVVASDNTLTVTGTVTANLGTVSGIALDATLAKLTVAQGAALGTNTQALVGGSVTTAAPSYTTGQVSPLSLTTAGAVRVDGSATTQPVSGTVTANVGTTGGLALDATLTGGTQRNRITDGTNNAAVKAASTAAVATDPALVVAISPNSSITATNPSVGTSGSAIPTSSTLIGASDGTNLQPTRIKAASTAAVATDPALVVAISPNNTVGVTGTVTSNIGTTNGLSLDATLAKLTVAQGTTLGTNTQALVGGSVTTAAPTYTTGQISPLSLTTAGAVRVDASGTTQTVSGTVTANIGTTGGVALDATLTGGTQRNKITDGTNNAAVKAASTAPVATDPALVVAISPNSSITATNPSVSTTGSAVPASATMIGASDGTNLLAARIKGASTAAVATDPALVVAVSPNNSVTVAQATASSLNATVVGSGSAGTAATGVLTVQGIASMVALKVDGSAVTQPVSGTVTANVGTTNGLALDATLAKLTVAQGAAIGTNTQALVGGSVTTASPTYTTGQVSPLSLTTAGAVRVDASGTTQPVSGTVTATNAANGTTGSAVPATATQVGGSDGTNLRALKTTATGALVIEGAGTAGAPSSNVLTIQGIAAGTALPMSSSFQASHTTIANQASTYSPDQSSYVVGDAQVLADASGRLETHSTVTTDEGSLRDDFAGSSLNTSIGTATFTNGSATVTGTGFQNLVTTNHYVKRDADAAATAWARVSSIDSNTQLTLANTYTGTTGTTASSQTLWPLTTSGGATGAVGSGNLTLATGTTSGATAYVFRTADYLPYFVQFSVSASQRIANQTLTFGFTDTWPTPNKGAYIQMTGTNSSQITLVTQSGPAGTETETLTLTLPTGVTTDQTLTFQLDIEQTQTTISVLNNGTFAVLGQNRKHLPGPYDTLGVVSAVQNTAAAGSSTSLVTDFVFFSNLDKIETTDSFTGSANRMALTDGTNAPVAVKPARTAPAVADPALVVALSPNSIAVGSDNRVQVGQDTVVFADPIDGTTINTYIWSQSQVTMTQSQSTSALTLNSGAITTINTSSILSSNRLININPEYSLYFSARARMVHPGANAVIELGVGSATTNAAPTDGVFFRLDATGALKGVINFGGTETTTAALGSLVSSTFYKFHIHIIESSIEFEVLNSDDTLVYQTVLTVPVTQPGVTSATRLPVLCRVYNSASAPASAPQLILGYVTSAQQDLGTNMSWAEQMSVAGGRIANVRPDTFVQALQSAAGAAPTSTTPTSTTVAYTTLGGDFSINMTATSENLLGVFGYTVPSPHTLKITDIWIPAPAVTTAFAATATIQQWVLMVANSTNPSTATGYRYPLSIFSAASSATIGTVMNGQPINFRPTAPIPVYPGQVVLLMVKNILAAATGVYRGQAVINGYYD